ncbi:MAG: RIP metalloprotease RseP [Thermoanaerobaculia bacterium]
MASSIATNLIAVVIVLGFLIFAHESGHFLMAKLFRVRVLIFSFGFGKRLFGFEKGGTDYRVSLIPLGGYVRMAGDMPEEEREGTPYEFLSKPKWQRFVILVAGPMANILIAILFLAWLNMAGTEVLRDQEARLGRVVPDKPAATAGLRKGDIILSAGGESIRSWDDLKLAVGMNPGQQIRIVFERDGTRHVTHLVPERVVTNYGVTGLAGVLPWISNEVGRVKPGSAADRAGLRSGDRIVGVAGHPVDQLVELEDLLGKRPGMPVGIEVERAGKRLDLTLPAQRSKKETWPGFIPPTKLQVYGPVEAFQESIDQNVKMLKYTFAVLGRLFRAQGSMKDFSGPISIARISGEMLRTGWKALVYLMAAISLQLGIMNLLPIPVLDGGHIMILAVETVARRDLSIQVKERIQQIGFAVLAALMIVVLYNDVIQNFMSVTRG